MELVGYAQRFGAALATIVCFLLLSPIPALAATSTSNDSDFNLTTSPLPVGLTTQPGQTITTPIKVENTGTKAVQLKVSLMKFSAYGTTGQPQIEDPTPADTYIKWASFSQNSFLAQPNVFYTITMTIKVPKDAAFGYYYAVVFSQANSKQPLTSRQNAVNGAVATLVLLDVNAPGEKRQVRVKSFTADHHIYQYLPATFTLTVQNIGNIHVVPTGNIFISRNQKSNIATLDINNGQGNVLPDSTRQFSVAWNDGFPNYQTKRINGQVVSDKTGKPVEQLHWDFSHVNRLRFGRYYAHMTLVYNNGKQDVPIEGVVSFWVIPWSLIMIVILIPTVPALLVYLFMRWRIRKKYGKKEPKHEAKS